LQGLSEPFGALLALILLHPFLKTERLQYLLAGTGGLMVRRHACEGSIVVISSTQLRS
jgi:zinc transporter ZupT